MMIGDDDRHHEENPFWLSWLFSGCQAGQIYFTVYSLPRFFNFLLHTFILNCTDDTTCMYNKSLINQIKNIFSDLDVYFKITRQLQQGYEILMQQGYGLSYGEAEGILSL